MCSVFGISKCMCLVQALIRCVGDTVKVSDCESFSCIMTSDECTTTCTYYIVHASTGPLF